MTDAACAQVDPDAHFPKKEEMARGRSAKRLCREVCTVREECLAYALEHDEQEGIWGGLDIAGRRLIKLGKAS